MRKFWSWMMEWIIFWSNVRRTKAVDDVCGFFAVRLAAHVSNGWKSLIRPSNGKDIAKIKSVHCEMESERRCKSLVWWIEITSGRRKALTRSEQELLLNYLQNSELYKHWYPILPVSSIQHDNHGISGIALSMPAIVGKDGIEGTVPISLNSQE